MKLFTAIAAAAVLITAAAEAAGPLDGVYEGSRTVVRSGREARCGSDITSHFRIKDGALLWETGGNLISIPIAQDGTFSQGVGGGTVSGRVAAGKITADFEGYCGIHYDLTKRP
jgi:hypothetical protein